MRSRNTMKLLTCLVLACSLLLCVLPMAISAVPIEDRVEFFTLESKTANPIEIKTESQITIKLVVTNIQSLPAIANVSTLFLYDNDTYELGQDTSLLGVGGEEEVVFNIDLKHSLDAGSNLPIKFVARTAGNISNDKEKPFELVVTIKAIKFYDFKITGKIDVMGTLKEDELLTVRIPVKNTGNSVGNLWIELYIDGAIIEDASASVTFATYESKDVEVGWTNPSKGTHTVSVKIYARTLDDSGDPVLSEVLDSKDTNVTIEKNNEIPTTYLIIGGIAIVLLIIVIVVIFKMTRKPNEGEKAEDGTGHKGKKGGKKHHHDEDE